MNQSPLTPPPARKGQVRGAALLLATALLTGPALASTENERLTRADIEFARGLAQRFSYVDLAEEVILGLESRKLSDELEEELGLAKCDVYAAGAGSEPDAEARLVLYDKAVEAYQQFIDGNPFSELLPQAERSYVDLANRYARALEGSLEEAVGEEAEATRDRIRSVLEDGLERTGDLIDALDDPDLSQTKKFEKYLLMLNRGQMLLTLANVSEEGTFFYGQAEEVLTDLALDAGELTGWGLRAYLFLGQVKLAQASYVEATDFLQFVVDTAVPIEADARESVGWNELTPDEKATRWSLAELGTADLVEAFRNAGYLEDACKWGLHFYNTWRVEGFSLGPYGYLSLLSSARALLDSGGYVGGSLNGGDLAWFATVEDMNQAGFSGRRNSRSALDLALSIAQATNAENKGNVLQIHAQKLISDVIDRPGVAVDPDVLFEAAQGEYFAKNYQHAQDAFKRVLRSLDSLDEARRREYGSKVMWHIGASLDRMDRQLEAAMAFREGATTWKDDPEYGPKNARGYYDALTVVRRNAPGDTLIEEMRREAENLRLELQEEGDTGDILFRQGDRAYSQEDYEGAREKYLQVDATQRAHEEALVKAAVCLYKQGQVPPAEEELRRYLEGFLEDPRNAVTAPSKMAARQKAKAQATYYVGLIGFENRDFGETVKWLDSFHEAFPAQTDYAPPALYMVLLAHLAEGSPDEARGVLDQMLAAFPTHVRTGSGALKIFGVLKQEQEAAEAAGDTASSDALKEKMVGLMNISNGLAKTPSFNNLRAESMLWMELERWAEAEQVLANMLQHFEEDGEQAQAIERFIKPDLGLCLLEQQKVPEAFAVLDPLVPDPDDDDDPRKPSASVVENWCRAVCGWLEGDGDTIVEVPGVGDAESVEDASVQWLRLENREDNWTCPWYRLTFGRTYCYYQWGAIDSSKLESAKNRIEELRQFLEDPDMRGISEACGDDLLRKRFLWLWGKVQ